MSTGWLVNSIDALRRVGVRTVIVCTTWSVSRPTPLIHAPTGAAILALPVPLPYWALRRRFIERPYGKTVEKTFGLIRPGRRATRIALGVVRELAPYLATSVWTLSRELKRMDAQAFVCQEYEFQRFDACAVVSKLTGIPLFASFQGGVEQRWSLERLIRPHSIKSCEGLIVGPREEAERVMRRYDVAPERIGRLWNSIDIDAWRPFGRTEARSELGIPTDARVVVWHGVVDIEWKGLDVLIDAWRHVCAERSSDSLRLLLFGKGQDAARLRRLAEESGCGNVVFVEDSVHECDRRCRYLSAADIYVLGSRHEWLASEPLEAMACGLPLVAADVSGIREALLLHGEASGGVVVRKGDARELAGAIGRLLDDDDLRRALGAAARIRMVDAFSSQVIGPQLREFILGKREKRLADVV
jgi:glycosyltransferase involved in cell wall biosynthesis